MQPKTAIKPTPVKAIPEGYHTITPGIICKDASKAMEFYKKALGATVVGTPMMCSETGKLGHAELKVGDSIFFISDENPQMGCNSMPTSLYLYVQDCDASFKRMCDAGATVKMPVTDMFWGDRMGKAQDAYGNVWTFATHKQDLTQDQIMAGQKTFMEQMKAQMAGGACTSNKKN